MPAAHPRLVVWLAAALSLSAGLAWAQPPMVAGRIKVSIGAASVIRNGQALPAPVGTEVFESDSVRTGADGRLGLTLRDETRVALGPDSEVALTAFAYQPAESRLGISLRVARGVLSYVSGLVAKLAPESVRIQTPTGIIGVRGTHALIRVGRP
jgi:hypothetical protein